MSDDEVVRNILLAIRFLALTPYPFAEGTQTDPRYAIALGGIAGFVEEALTAVAEDRKMRLYPDEETLTDAERVRLLRLCIRDIPHNQGDDDLTGIIGKISGTDTVLVARRAYPSRSTQNG